jgi:hypothetical protein
MSYLRGDRNAVPPLPPDVDRRNWSWSAPMRVPLPYTYKGFEFHDINPGVTSSRRRLRVLLPSARLAQQFFPLYYMERYQPELYALFLHLVEVTLTNSGFRVDHGTGMAAPSLQYSADRVSQVARRTVWERVMDRARLNHTTPATELQAVYDNLPLTPIADQRRRQREEE